MLKIDGYFIYGFVVGVVVFSLAKAGVISWAAAFCTLPMVSLTAYAHAKLLA